MLSVSDMPAKGMLCWNVRISPRTAIACTCRPSMRSATKRDRYGAWRDDTTKGVEGRGLASAVRPDQSQDLAGAQIERQVLDHHQPAEVGAS